VWINVDGVSKPLGKWIEECGVSYAVYYHRKAQGWTDKDALYTPVHTSKLDEEVVINQVTKTIREWLKHFKVTKNTFYVRRKRKKMSIIDALTYRRQCDTGV
jgi:hypothetical protein